MGDTVNMVDKDGNVTPVPKENVAGAMDQGFHVESKDEGIRRAGDQALKEHYSSAPMKFAAGVTSIADAATLGGYSAGVRALGGEDAAQDLRRVHEYNPGISTVASLAGAALPGGLIGKLGGSVAAQVGEGVAGRIAGGAAEGAIYGAGNAVSELAQSADPLTAEHIASALSSNVLLGGAIGGGLGGAFALGEKALGRASAKLAEASAARNAIEGVPEDLAGLDDSGLQAAHKAASAEHAADIAAETKSLEGLRAEKKANLANEVRDLHADLATERPIYSALSNGDDLNPALKGIEGVGDARVQLAKSFSSLRSTLDHEITVAREPFRLLQPLEDRQAALEKLQAAAPEIQAAMAGDARAGVFQHVDDALAETKQQIQAIRTLKETPIAGERLTMLKAGPSGKMQTIAAAREALKKGPELGLIGKAAKTAAFGGGTALAHMIPGVGIAAPFLGKGASDMVGKLFEHLAGAQKAVTAKSSAALQSFLGVAEKAAPVVRMTATKVLGAAKFGPGPEPKSQSLPDLFKARSAEIRQQTAYAPDGSVQVRPEVRLQIAHTLAPIASVNPSLADQIETVKARGIALISQLQPKRPEVGGLQIGPDKWQPSDLAIRSWARTIRACEDPGSVEENLAHGVVTPEEAEAYRTVYPERFAAMQQAIFQAAPLLSKTLPMKRKIALSVFTGIPLIPALQPNVLAVLQGNFAVEPGSAGGSEAPKPMPSFGALGSMKSIDKPTPSQQREGA